MKLSPPLFLAILTWGFLSQAHFILTPVQLPASSISQPSSQLAPQQDGSEAGFKTRPHSVLMALEALSFYTSVSGTAEGQDGPCSISSVQLPGTSKRFEVTYSLLYSNVVKSLIVDFNSTAGTNSNFGVTGTNDVASLEIKRVVTTEEWEEQKKTTSVNLLVNEKSNTIRIEVTDSVYDRQGLTENVYPACTVHF